MPFLFLLPQFYYWISDCLKKKGDGNVFEVLLSSHLYSLLDFHHDPQVNNKFSSVRILRPKDILTLLLELNVPPKQNSVTGMKWRGEGADDLLKLLL